ncbi:hypothetical protein Pmani_007741 [Petrolisthes manimaculis]|uniref:Uncharacterized protein n=1 Tax=Petrolisthes manimaculis TaxID=1843537 RepID=A0AAE1Q893_9EUCA|nr:hypothetical protein Pmani_007741 [Petrolisthes manimaculis]
MHRAESELKGEKAVSFTANRDPGLERGQPITSQYRNEASQSRTSAGKRTANHGPVPERGQPIRERGRTELLRTPWPASDSRL